MDADIEYAAEYQHDGATWALNFFAKDSEDAAAKLRSIRAGAVLLGEIAGVIRCDSNLELGNPSSSNWMRK